MGGNEKKKEGGTMNLRKEQNAPRGELGKPSGLVRNSIRHTAKWAAAGALGLALLIGAPNNLRAQDVQPPAAAEQARSTSAEQLSSFVASLNQPLDSESHPANATDPETLAGNILTMSGLRDLLARDRPSEEDPMRAVYDAASSAPIDQSLIRAARNLLAIADERAAAESGPEFTVGRHNDDLVAALSAIDLGIGEGEEQYVGLDPAGTSIARILRLLRGGQSADTLDEEDRAVPRAPLPLIAPPRFDPGSFVLLTGTGSDQAVAFDPEVTPTLVSLFGSEAIASNVMGALGSAYATQINNPGDLGAQQDAARALHAALSQIPANKEIWSRPEFNAAMAALARGDLQGGLNHLSNEVSFNAAYQALNNLHYISISQRAIARIRAGATVRFPWRGNEDDFLAYRRRQTPDSFDWDALHVDLGVEYLNLLISGFDQTLMINPDTNTATVMGDRRRINGSGHSIELNTALTLGGSMFEIPTELTLHFAAGYRWWEVETNVGGRSLVASDASPYVGHWGLRADFPGYDGQTSSFRLERLGIGAVALNPLVYATISQRWMEGNEVSLHTRLTPYYLLFWGNRFSPETFAEETFFQHRIGADLRPIDITYQPNASSTWFFGPGVRYEISLDHDSEFGGIHSLDVYGNVGYRHRRGFEFDLRGGAAGEVGGEKYQRLPWTPTVSLNITLTPALMSSDEPTDSGGESSD